MKSKASTTYKTKYSRKVHLVLSNNHEFTVYATGGDDLETQAKMPVIGLYAFVDGRNCGKVTGFAGTWVEVEKEVTAADEGKTVVFKEKVTTTTTTYPPFYHKAKKSQSLYVKKNGAIGNEPDVYVKTGGTIKKLY